MSAPEFRRDPVIGRWIIVASDRRGRPRDTADLSPVISEAECPFCPGREDQTPSEIASRRFPPFGLSDWKLRSFLSIDPVVDQCELSKQGEGMFDMMTGFGAHEVIVNTPDHFQTVGTMNHDAVRDLFLFWRERLAQLKKEDQFRYLTLFANKGVISGAHVEHSHSQIIATPTVPRRISEEIAMCYTYFQSKERCVFCDIIETDGSGDRLVYQNDHVTVVTPFASRFPYEMWLLPREHSSHFEDFDENIAGSLADALRFSLAALKNALDDPPYSFVLHTAPTHERGMVHYHWHIEIMPRLNQLAGFEWGTGFYINPVPPEEAAQILRESLP